MATKNGFRKKNQKSFSPKNILLKSVEHKRTDFSTSVTKFSPPPFFNDFKNVIVHFPNHTFYLPLSRVSPVNQVQIQRRPKNTCEFSSFKKMRFFKISARSRNFGRKPYFSSRISLVNKKHVSPCQEARIKMLTME